MNLRISYLENTIMLNNENVFVVEVENKKMFYRLVSDLYKIKDGELLNEFYFYDNSNKEINVSNKIEVYSNFFKIDFNTKKNLTILNKTVLASLDDNEKTSIMNNLKKLYKTIGSCLNDIDLPLILNDEITIDDIVKLFKISFNFKDDLLEKLLLLIDIERNFKINMILFFVNLKQYLNKVELEELYKFAIYNNVKLILIDSQSYGVKLNYEKKLIIDNDLVEFVL